MNGIMKIAFAGVVASIVAMSQQALASDLLDEASVPEVVMAPKAISGWYLRGDLGYDISTKGGIKAVDTADNRVARSFDLDKGLAPSIGVGYHFNDYLRADVTAGYSRQDVNGFPAKLRSWDVMANAYVDIGNLAGVTPYLGAGLGVANVRYSIDSSYGDIKSDDDYRFAWALMAGIAVDLTENVKLDLGYRYGVINGGNVASGGGVTLSDKDIKSHQLRAGLRVATW
ncbi:outer membrane protein [Brucella sp. BE17]|uniref:outer membrane protein n=1 Tax=Brucella sp. BE17 TaxID=3142977 RepID=UPI0031BA4DCE